MADYFEEHRSPEGETLPPSQQSAQSEDAERQPNTPAYQSSSDPYGSDSDSTSSTTTLPQAAKSEQPTSNGHEAVSVDIPARRTPPPAPPSPPDDDDDNNAGDEEKGMLRMSFMEHL